MRALTWQGQGKVSVEQVADPSIQEPTDAIVRVTSTAICGSDMHLYTVLAPFLTKGDILGHEFMGIVEEVGSGVTNLKPGDRVVVKGAGPVGQLAVASAQYLGIEDVIVVDRVPERLERMKARGARTINLDDLDGSQVSAVGDAVRDLTGGRGADGVVDAVGMEAHGNPVAAAGLSAVSKLPSAISEPFAKKAGIDRLAALHAAIDSVRRSGTVSVSGVYGGALDPMPMMQMFDKGIAMRMGPCHVKQWTDELRDVLVDADPFGVEQLATHRVGLDEAATMYDVFQKKQDGCQKVVLKP